MRDSLKDFINSNRDRFDDRQPTDSLWTSIEKRLPSQQRTLWNSLKVWRAAAIMLLGLSVYLAVIQTRVANPASRQLTSEFIDLDKFYNSQIAEKADLVAQFQQQTGESEDEITQNLQKLEAMYQVLKLEMKKRPTHDVKDALVLNLLVRIDLLNQQLNKLDRREESKEPVTKNV